MICLALAIILSIDVGSVSTMKLPSADALQTKSPGDQSIQVFSMVITLVTIGSVVVTVNAKLLGGRVSFFQSLVRSLLQLLIHEVAGLIPVASEQCVLGYCLFPLLVAAVISMFLHNLLIRLPVSLIAWGWAVWGE